MGIEHGLNISSLNEGSYWHRNTVEVYAEIHIIYWLIIIRTDNLLCGQMVVPLSILDIP